MTVVNGYAAIAADVMELLLRLGFIVLEGCFQAGGYMVQRHFADVVTGCLEKTAPGFDSGPAGRNIDSQRKAAVAASGKNGR